MNKGAKILDIVLKHLVKQYNFDEICWRQLLSTDHINITVRKNNVVAGAVITWDCWNEHDYEIYNERGEPTGEYGHYVPDHKGILSNVLTQLQYNLMMKGAYKQ